MKSNAVYWVIGICLLGCTPSQPATKSVGSNGNTTAESHEHASASTLQEAMKQLDEHAETISKAFLAKTPDDAHDALHKVGDLLMSIPALASHLSEEKKSVVKKSSKELFECFGALDETMHGGPDTPFSTVADRITAAMAELKTASESL